MENNKNHKKVTIRQAAKTDFEDILALNEELAQYLSHLTMEKLEHLYDEAAMKLVVEEDGKFAGFLLGFREGADYDSVNYTWFESHYPTFLYVDRIVITPDTQSGGLGSALYREVFRTAQEANVPVVTAEYNVMPPNVISEKFHNRFGFKEVGRQKIADGEKIVSLQVATL